MTSNPNPSSPARPGGDTADAPLTVPLDWPTLVEHQRRWWTEWLEAGQLWTSWWVLQWPAFGWPPVGQVLPPDLTATDAPQPPAGDETVPPGMAGSGRRPNRSPGARHH